MNDCDLIVVGGGPAGTTLATLVKKHAPGRRVILLEKAPGPRHHIGESLLPGLVPVLKEMGVFEKIDGAGFPRKLGANYVWGRDRAVWENDFNDVTKEISRHGKIPEKIEYAWRSGAQSTTRSCCAMPIAVEVRRGAVATGSSDGERRRRGPAGGELRGEFRRLQRPERLFPDSAASGNTIRSNNAGYAYFGRALGTASGHPDKTQTVCRWLPWYIPIAADVVSGLVTSVEFLKKSALEPEALFMRELGACAEIGPLLAGARRIEDFDGTGQGFFTHQDWSYLNVAAAGLGWLAAGDAAVFVDPILSSGVTLAHLAGHRAAYTLLTQWAGAEPAVRELLWSDYNAFCRESAAQFLVLALFWYGNDRSAESWWGKAKGLQRAWLPVEPPTRFAFVSSG